jgi:hypothetical protein
MIACRATPCLGSCCMLICLCNCRMIAMHAHRSERCQLTINQSIDRVSCFAVWQEWPTVPAIINNAFSPRR